MIINFNYNNNNIIILEKIDINVNRKFEHPGIDQPRSQGESRHC